MQRIVIIDNYDSFTYNLSHLLKEAGADVIVIRNDRFQLEELQQFDKIVLSPGPGIPSEAGLLLSVINTYAPTKPILGVCLGHQAIGEAFGARLQNLDDVVHGVATPCRIVASDPIFDGLLNKITVCRYHSWVVSSKEFPSCLEITAVSDDGSPTDDGVQTEHIMALRHRQYEVHGIQFHPESVLTPEGKTIIKNFIDL